MLRVDAFYIQQIRTGEPKGAKLAVSDPDISKSDEEFGKALGIVLRESEETTGDDDELFHESDEEEEEGDEDEEDDLEPM